MDDALASLAAAGFDLAHAFDARLLAQLPAWAAHADGPPVGYLIGNTRALWAPFRAALRDPALAADANPLERYTEQTIGAALPTARVWYAHRQYDGAYLPFQPLAIASGLGAAADSHLVIHPTFGPWFALRAVVLVEGTPPVRAPIAKPCRCTAACGDALAIALASGDWRAWVAVRGACSLSAHRYSEDQIRYHYRSAWLTLRRP